LYSGEVQFGRHPSTLLQQLHLRVLKFWPFFHGVGNANSPAGMSYTRAIMDSSDIPQ
jgi:hypothetical protein